MKQNKSFLKKNVSKNRKIIPIEEIKKIQLEILIQIHNFCLNKGINYFLAYGSLIGAIRHNGYIPWDDDIDIAMPRPDYDRFIREFTTEKGYLKVYAPELDWNYYAPYANVCDERTILEEGFIGHGKTPIGLKIDVFPIDGTPDDEIECKKLRCKIDKLNSILRFKNYKWLQILSNDILFGIKCIVKRILYFIYSFSNIQKKILKSATSCSYNESQYVDNMVFICYPYTRFPKKAILDYIDVKFEGYFFKAPKDYDTYLRAIYGDYMQLPPEEKRVMHHNFTAYWKE